MTRFVIDTHTWVWFADGDAKLPSSLGPRLAHSDGLVVSAVSIYEIGQKVRLGKWPGMTTEKLVDMVALAGEGLEIFPLDAAISMQASLLAWDHRDPFDRMIAASALELGAPLVSRDPVFDTVAGLERLWDA